MTRRELDAHLREIGASVRADGDRLVCRFPSGSLTPDLRLALAEHKADLMAELNESPAASGCPRTAPPSARTEVPPEAPGAPDAPPPCDSEALTPTSTARCRDCWRWQPDGIKHGCAAGVESRPSPDWRGDCRGFDEVA